MIALDLRTIYLTLTLANLVSIFVVASFYSQLKNRYAGLQLIVLSFILPGLGLSLLLFRDFFADWLSIILGNSLVIIGSIFLLFGLSKFIGKKVTKSPYLILFLVFFGINAFLTFYKYDLNFRIINSSLFSTIIYLQIVWILLEKRVMGSFSMTRGVGILTLISAALYFIRLLYYLFFSGNNQDYFQSDAFEAWFVLFQGVCYMVLAFTIVMMYNKRLLIDVKKEEEKFSKAFNSSSIAIVLHKISDGSVFDVNTGFEAITGYAGVEVIGKDILNTRLFENKKNWDAIIKEVQQQNGIQDREFIFKKKSGEYFNGLLSAEIININGEECLISVINDLSHVKHAELEVKKAYLKAKELEAIINRSNSIAFLWRIDEDWPVEYVSQNVDMLGYSQEELITGETSYDEIIHPDDKQKVKADVSEYKRNGTEEYIQEYRIITKSGEVRWMKDHTWIRKGPKGTYTHHQGILQDITEMKKASEQIRKLSQAVEQSPASIIITDLEGNIEYVNPKFTSISGYSREEVYLKNPRILKSETTSPEEYKNLWMNIAAGKEWRGEFYNKRKNGENYWEAASISAIKNEKGENTHYIAVKEDITIRKAASLKLKQSEADLQIANATKDKFFSIIAHDLRAPFNSIFGYTKILTQQVQQKNYDQVLEYAEIIEQSTGRTFNLLTNLMDWAKSQSGRMNFNPIQIDVADLIQDTVVLLNDTAAQKGIRFSLNLPPKLEIVGDFSMLETVVRNLISNAIKFTNRDGEIVISALQEDDGVTFRIKDNGVGIEKEDQNKLFRIDGKYSTLGTQQEVGTGLGLILCKEFVNKHQGQIGVESEVGKGSTFFFTIPNLNNQ